MVLAPGNLLEEKFPAQFLVSLIGLTSVNVERVVFETGDDGMLAQVLVRNLF